MTLREIMTSQVIRIRPEEPVAVAARILEHYNIGILPVCGSDGRLCGMVTDRDIVTRCLASGRAAEATTVKDVMTSQVVSGTPDMASMDAAELMRRAQIRRLPVLENGRLCGMVSLGDLAVRQETAGQAGSALAGISRHLSSRE